MVMIAKRYDRMRYEWRKVLNITVNERLVHTCQTTSLRAINTLYNFHCQINLGMLDNYCLWVSNILLSTTELKVNFTLEQAMKAQRRSRVIALLFLQPRHQMGMGDQSHAPTALHPRKIPGAHCTGSWVSSSVILDGCGKMALLLEFDPRTAQPVASRYTDYSTPVHTQQKSLFKSNLHLKKELKN